MAPVLAIILILACIYILSRIMQLTRYGWWLTYLISYIILYVISGLVTYTPDWDAYEYFMYNKSDSTDWGFRLISSFALKNKLDFSFVHLVHILITSLFFLLFIKKFDTKNPFLILLLYIPFVYLYYTTQIRFFTGYYMAVLALYYLLIHNNKLAFLLLFVVAFINHSSLILLLGFLLLHRLSPKLFVNYVYLLSLLVFAFFQLLSYWGIDILQDGKISAYTQAEGLSSFAGGMFNFLPYILLSLLTIHYYKQKIKKNPELNEDFKFDFLYKLSLYPLLFIILTMSIQVFGHRFIYSSLLFNVLLFYYGESKAKSKLVYHAAFYLFFIFLFFYVYFLPQIVLDEGNPFEQIQLMLISNKGLNLLYN